MTYDELTNKVFQLEETVKKIIALPQLSKLARRDAEILVSRVKGTELEGLSAPAISLPDFAEVKEKAANETAETIHDTLENTMDTFLKNAGDVNTQRWMMTREELTAERIQFLWDLFRPGSPHGKNAWLELKKEKPYLFDD